MSTKLASYAMPGAYRPLSEGDDDAYDLDPNPNVQVDQSANFQPMRSMQEPDNNLRGYFSKVFCAFGLSDRPQSGQEYSRLNCVCPGLGYEVDWKEEQAEEEMDDTDRCICDTQFESGQKFCAECGMSRRKVWLAGLLLPREEWDFGDFKEKLSDEFQPLADQYFDSIDYNKTKTIDKAKWEKALKDDIVDPDMFQYLRHVHKVGELNDDHVQLRLFSQADNMEYKAIYFCGQPILVDGVEAKCGDSLEVKDCDRFYDEHQPRVPDSLCPSCKRYNLQREINNNTELIREKTTGIDFWQAAMQEDLEQLIGFTHLQKTHQDEYDRLTQQKKLSKHGCVIAEVSGHPDAITELRQLMDTSPLSVKGRRGRLPKEVRDESVFNFELTQEQLELMKTHIKQLKGDISGLKERFRHQLSDTRHEKDEQWRTWRHHHKVAAEAIDNLAVATSELLASRHGCREATLSGPSDTLDIYFEEMKFEEVEKVDTQIAFVNEFWQVVGALGVPNRFASRHDIQQLSVALRAGEHLKQPPGPKYLQWVEGDHFVCFTACIIAFNLWAMAMELLHDEFKKKLFLVDQFFLVFYIIEIILKGMLFQKELLIGRPSVVWWNWLDLVIVIGGVLDQWLKPLFTLVSGGQPGHRGGSIINALRVLRLARVAKLAAVFFKSDLSWTKKEPFQMFITGVIAFNSVMIALEYDVPWEGWYYIEMVMLVIYVFELLVRFRHEGCGFFSDEDMVWNWMDFIIVLGAVVDSWLMPAVKLCQKLMGFEGSDHKSKMGKVLMMLRMARLLRILRLVRLIKAIPPLLLLISGLTKAMAGMMWVGILTAVCIYMVALVFDALFGHGLAFGDQEVPREITDEFANVFQCWWVLFKAMNGDFGSLEPLWDFMPLSKAVTVGWVVISSWAMLSLLTSVVTDSMMKATEDLGTEKAAHDELERLRRSQDQLNRIFDEADVGKTGYITQQQWEALMSDPRQVSKLQRISMMPKDSLEQIFSTASETYAVENREEVDQLVRKITADLSPGGSPDCRASVLVGEAEELKSVEHRRLIGRKAFIDHLQNESRAVTERSVLMISSRLAKVEKQIESRMGTLMHNAQVQQDTVTGRTSEILSKCMQILVLLHKDPAVIQELKEYEERLKEEYKGKGEESAIIAQLDTFVRDVPKMKSMGTMIGELPMGVLASLDRSAQQAPGRFSRQASLSGEDDISAITPRSDDRTFILSVSIPNQESPTRCTIKGASSVADLVAKLCEKLNIAQESSSLEYWDPIFKAWHLPGDDLDHIPSTAKVRIALQGTGVHHVPSREGEGGKRSISLDGASWGQYPTWRVAPAHHAASPPMTGAQPSSSSWATGASMAPEVAEVSAVGRPWALSMSGNRPTPATSTTAAKPSSSVRVIRHSPRQMDSSHAYTALEPSTDETEPVDKQPDSPLSYREVKLSEVREAPKDRPPDSLA